MDNGTGVQGSAASPPFLRDPVQGITVGRIVHYTDANHDGGKYTPTKALAAMVVAVSDLTGKPTLMVWRPGGPGTLPPPGAPAGTLTIYTTIIVDAEFSTEPGGTMAARGCWSWPVPSPGSEAPCERDEFRPVPDEED